MYLCYKVLAFESETARVDSENYMIIYVVVDNMAEISIIIC